MPSPFPGMDPYLEAPGIWPGFLNRLAVGISEELNRLLPAPYSADIEEREELGIIEEPGQSRRIIPDIVVVKHPLVPPRGEGVGVAVATRTRREISPNVELEVFNEPIRHLFVEIRDPTRGHWFSFAPIAIGGCAVSYATFLHPRMQMTIATLGLLALFIGVAVQGFNSWAGTRLSRGRTDPPAADMRPRPDPRPPG